MTFPCVWCVAPLFIKQRLGLTEEETVHQIWQQAYMQFFLGFAGYSTKTPFDPSMVVHFRKRFCDEDLMRINEVVVQRDKEMLIESVIDDSGVLDLGCAGQDAVTVAPENLTKELQATLKYFVKTPRFHC